MEILEREPALDQMRRLLARAREASGCLLWIGGEAGAGKSALIRRFAAETGDRAAILIGTCDPLSTPLPLGPLLDVVDTLPTVDALLTENAPRPQIFRAVLAALGRGRRPTCFVIEDAHWADEATLDLIRYLARRLDATRALLVVTYRSDEVAPPHPLSRVIGDLASVGDSRRITIPPLSPAAVATLAEESDLDPVALHRQTGGNPFFVTEVLAAGGIPATVHDAVLARALRLPPAARAVLDAAAVLGDPTDVPLLQRVAAVDHDAIAACLAAGMIEADDGLLAFRHEIARQAILAAISPAHLGALHGRALDALAMLPLARGDPARLAHPAEAAGDQAAVLRHAPAAARRAAALRSHQEAAAQFGRALRFADVLPPTERALLLEAQANEYHLGARIDQAIVNRQQAAAIWREAGDALKVGENQSHLASLHWGAARREAAEREAVAAIATLELLPPSAALALAYEALSRVKCAALDEAAAISWGERAIALAERLDARQTLVDALINVGSTRHYQGDDRGRAQLERARDLAVASGLDLSAARALCNLGAGYGQSYRFREAVPYFAACIAFSEERDIDHTRFYATSWLASSRFMQGAWDAAAALASSVLHVDHLPPITRYDALLALGLIRLRRGEEGASACFDEALALAEGSGSLGRIAPIRAARAEAAWLAGDVPTASAEAGSAYDRALQEGQPWWLGDLAFWRWRTGTLDAPPPGIAHPFALQIAGRWQAAAAAWDDLGCPYEAARARADGDDEAALRRALATFDHLGARSVANPLRRRLRRRGAAAIPRGPRPSTRTNPSRLTRRQSEILALLAADLSTPEIAGRLFLSPRTVDNHVAAIMRKLAVASRVEAVLPAVERGLLPPN